MNSEKIEKSLKQWKLPRSSPSDVFKRRGIFKFCPDPTLQTVEKEIPLSEGNASFPLFTNDVQRVYQSQYSFLHIGMIQVALKPTKLGLNTSAIICLRDKRFLKFDQSVMAMVESNLCDGPIYFSYFPTHCVALCDRHSTFTIDVNSQGEGEVILMYRFHYKVMCEACPDKKNLLRSLVDRRGETTLFVINVSQSGSKIRAASKKIYWDEVPVPEKWMDDSNPSSSAGAGEEGEMVRMDWKEAAGAYALKVDVPGFKIEEVEVEAKAGRELVISGENEEENGKFLRRLRLPEDAKMDEVKAAMENGVLTVTLPKEEDKEKRPVVLKVVHISG